MVVNSGEFADFTLERAMDAEVLDVFSARNGKLVELVRDENSEFVRRKYLPEAVHEVEQVGLPFGEAWNVYVQMFDNAGLEIVDCALMEETLDDNPIIVAKFLGGLGREASPKSLPSEAKIELAGNIGRLLTSHPDFMPASQGLLPDAFAIDPMTSKAVLVDVDPYLVLFETSRFGAMRTEAAQGAFMRRSGLNIAAWAVDDDERTAMASAFCRTAGVVLRDDASLGLFNQFGYVHFMANGMSPKQLEQMGY
jgi:hypothetical protein